MGAGRTHISHLFDKNTLLNREERGTLQWDDE